MIPVVPWEVFIYLLQYILEFIDMYSNPREVLTENFTKTIKYKLSNYILINQTISILNLLKLKRLVIPNRQ